MYKPDIYLTSNFTGIICFTFSTSVEDKVIGFDVNFGSLVSFKIGYYTYYENKFFRGSAPTISNLRHLDKDCPNYGRYRFKNHIYWNSRHLISIAIKANLLGGEDILSIYTELSP